MITLTENSPRYYFDKPKRNHVTIFLDHNTKFIKPKWFGLFGSKTVDIELQLGMFIQYKDGRKSVIQALGNSKGSLTEFPYAELEPNNQYITIHGSRWDDIDRLQIYVYKPSNAIQWNELNTTVVVELEPNKQVQMVLSADTPHNLCASTLIKVKDYGSLIMRMNSYHFSHSLMDKAYDWGLTWHKQTKE